MKALLTGKTAIITGASQGIGLATAQLFAQEGALSSQEAAVLPPQIGPGPRTTEFIPYVAYFKGSKNEVRHAYH